jgi:GAF domain-containing protein
MTFLQRLNPLVPPENIDPEDSRVILLHQLLQSSLIILTASAILQSPFLMASFIQYNAAALFIPYGLFVIWMVICTFIKKIPFLPRVYSGMTFITIFGILEMLSGQNSGIALLMILLSDLYAMFLIGPRSAIPVSIISFLFYVLLGYLADLGLLAPLKILGPLFLFSSNWSGGIFALIICLAITIPWILLIRRYIAQNQDQYRELNSVLTALRGAFDRRIEENNLQIQKQAQTLETTNRIIQGFSAWSSYAELVQNTLESLKTEFELYFVGYYVADSAQEYLNFIAGTGNEADLLDEQNYRIRIDPLNPAGYAYRRLVHRIITDTRRDLFGYQNPSLPDSVTQLIIPLKPSEVVNGILDFHSDKEGRFDQDTVKLLLTISAQFALALERSQLLTQLQSSLDEVDKEKRQFTQQSWFQHLQATRRRYHYRFSSGKVEGIASPDPNSLAAIENGQTHLTTIPQEGKGGGVKTSLAIPIKLRGQILGAMDIRFDKENIPQDTIALLEEASNRIALALETARLLEEIQLSAERERMIGDIITQVRTSSDIDGILRTAANELGKTFGVSEVLVSLRTPEES